MESYREYPKVILRFGEREYEVEMRYELGREELELNFSSEESDLMNRRMRVRAEEVDEVVSTDLMVLGIFWIVSGRNHADEATQPADGAASDCVLEKQGNASGKEHRAHLQTLHVLQVLPSKRCDPPFRS